ncbi:gene transfer agent family protein [Inquilinus sp. CA228]|uniref:gene transfer agent family protein n=1 Tax=Inquilinus sp. CA228 TaxID=3455609 RepID=UPI003F8D157E
MSADGSIELPFGDGRHLFRLAIGQWRKLEELRKLGPLRLYDRVRNGDWFTEDLYQSIRLGLIGGGMAAPEALRLTDLYFDDWLKARGLLNAEGLVAVIMGASLVGMETDPVGKPKARAAARKPASRASTATPSPPAASRRSRSTG